MDYLTRFLRRTITVLTIVGAFSLVGIMLVVVANIISRVFKVPILGTYEAVELAAVPMVAFALGYCALMQGHVFMSMIIDRLSQPVRRVIAVVTTFLTLGIWVLIGWQVAKYARQQWLVGEATYIMSWPIYPLRYVFFLGIVVFCLVLFKDLFNALREGRK